ncbi:MAG: hypothetical protein IKZ35_04995 [Clostridia bacterium]|nr:hypothetical protein [Clostridia bacterium]
MKKRISLLVAIVMLFSSVAAYAVSDVEYAWYDEDDSKFYVFGTYANDTVGSGAYKVSDVGVYVNGEKFTYLQDGITVPNAAEAKFGFEFTGSPSEFKVQPYTTNSYGEHLGFERELDLTADNLGNEIKVSNNALLKNVFVHRDIAANVNVLTGMYPAFDPEVKEYEVYGYFGAGNANMTSVELYCEAFDPAADIDIVDSFTSWNSGNGAALYGKDVATGTFNNKKIVTVTSADKSNTETYIFNINTNNIYKNDAQNVSYMTLNSGYNVEVNGANVTKSAAPATGAALTVKPSVGATYNKYAVMSFPITANMATTDNIALNMRATNISYANGFKNLTIAARAFDATNNTVGKIGGTFTVPDTTVMKNNTTSYATSNIFLDVTELVKDAIDADQTSVDIAVQIIDAEADGCAVVPSWTITYMTYTNNYRPVLLVK